MKKYLIVMTAFLSLTAYANNSETTTKDQEQLNKNLLTAATEGCTDDIEQLVYQGAKLSAKNVHGQTPLHLVSLYGHLDATRLIIAFGADVNAKDKKGYMPLDYALTGKFADITQILIATDEIEMSYIEILWRKMHPLTYFYGPGPQKSVIIDTRSPF